MKKRILSVLIATAMVLTTATAFEITLTQDDLTAEIQVGAGINGRVPIVVTAPDDRAAYIESSNITSGHDPALYDSSGRRIADDEAGFPHFRYMIPAGETMTVYAGTFANGAADYTVSIVFSQSLILAGFDDNDYQKLVDFALQYDNLAKLGWDLDNPGSWNGIWWHWEGIDKQVHTISLAGLDLQGVLDVSGFSALMFLDAGDNRLTGINLADCPRLTNLFLYNNLLDLQDADFQSSIQEIRENIDGLWGRLILIPQRGDSVPTPQGYDDYEFQKLVEFALQGGNLQNLWWDFSDPQTWSMITWNEESPRQVTHVWQRESDATGVLDVSGFTKLEEIRLREGRLSELNASNTPLLETIIIDENRLTKINISNTPSLRELYVCDNFLRELDVSQSPALETLWASYNFFIDISSFEGLQNLRMVDVSGNFLDLDDPAIQASIAVIQETVNSNHEPPPEEDWWWWTGSRFYYDYQRTTPGFNTLEMRELLLFEALNRNWEQLQWSWWWWWGIEQTPENFNGITWNDESPRSVIGIDFSDMSLNGVLDLSVFTALESYDIDERNVYVPTEPPVTTTEPPVTTIKPPVMVTKPPVTVTEPPVTTTEPPVTTIGEFILGDVNGDGVVDIQDALEILKYLAGLESTVDFDATIDHALEILKYLAGLPNKIFVYSIFN